MEETRLPDPDHIAPHDVSPFRRDELHRHDKTAGEEKFNWRTYTGVGYFANVGISLASVYWAERTQGGQKFIRGIGDLFGKMGADEGWAKFLGRKSFFLAGGFAVIPVMKWLEDHKVDLVKKYNREIYGEHIGDDPAIAQSEHELEVAPKQSWASFISGRFLALVPFYATVGLLWDRESVLGIATNPELRSMTRDARKLMADKEPERYAQIAAKGWYFDRPISHFSRDLGKLISSRGTYFDAVEEGAGPVRKLYRGAMSLAGKLLRILPESPATLKEIEQAEAAAPGMIQSQVDGTHKADPIHAVLPYYAISEAITSAMVAWGLYVITRVTGPFFDRKPHEAPAQAETPALAAAAPEKPVDGNRPSTTITTRDTAEKLADAPALVTARAG